MKLSVSNIAWPAERDCRVYELMKQKGFSGMEIAPTRIFQDRPYSRMKEAKTWVEQIRSIWGLEVPSIQAIWYGRDERLFGSVDERRFLTEYTQKAVDFAQTIGCRNIVFGCPRNRCIPDGFDENIAIGFFREIGDYAYKHNTVIGLEANPPIYNTNYINDTQSAFRLIRDVDSKGFKLNLDVGTMIENNEDVSVLIGHEKLINHVHISEPMLKPIKQRQIHNDLCEILRKNEYKGYISIEVEKQEDINQLEKMMEYVAGVFG